MKNKEYTGKNAKIYELTERKKYTLIPEIQKVIKKTSKKQKLLDLGCGNGEFYDMVIKKGYQYFGLDYSKDMIRIAKEEHPEGKYLVANSINFSKFYKKKFNVILSVLLLPALENYEMIIRTLKDCKKVLKPGGELIIGTVNPYFDKYMLSNLVGDKSVQSSFKGYFNTGAKFQFKKFFSKGEFTFTDYHYTFTNYLEAFRQAGLTLTEFVECNPTAELKKTNSKLYEKFSRYPGYIIFVCKN